MASDFTSLAAAAEEEKTKLKEEKKKFKQDQKAQKKEAKRRAAEIAKQEEALGEGDGNGLVTVLATFFIVILWLAVIVVVVKMDIGGFGSSVLTPVLKDVPVLNMILPGESGNSSVNPDVSQEGYGGYSSIEEAVEAIRKLELELDRIQTASNSKDTDIENLRAEVERLREFEQRQVEFQRIQTEFYDEVVYSDKGPGAEEYRKYYEEINPSVAEYLYKQVIAQAQENTEFQAYAQTFAEMKPKEAAAAFEEMTDSLDRVARILNAIDVEARAKILDAMDKEVVAKLAKIMDPQS